MGITSTRRWSKRFSRQLSTGKGLGREREREGRQLALRKPDFITLRAREKALFHVVPVACLAIFTLALISLGRISLIPRSAAESSHRDVDASLRQRIVENYSRLPLRFESNQGQTDQRARFVARGHGYDLFLTNESAVLSLASPRPAPPDSSRPQPSDLDDSSKPLPERSVVRLDLIGANPGSTIGGEDELPGKTNYFTGNDPQGWHTNIPTYGKVRYKSVYPGVDLVYYGNEQHLEFDFVVAARGDLRAVKFRVAGADRLSLNDQGDLVLALRKGNLSFSSR